jgi:hypothetical protein
MDQDKLLGTRQMFNLKTIVVIKNKKFASLIFLNTFAATFINLMLIQKD